MIPFSILAALTFIVPYYLLGTYLGPEFASIIGSIIGMFLTVLAAKFRILVPKYIWHFKGEDVDADHELEFRNKYESIKKGDFHTDILYVITERVLSVENEFSLRDGFILDAYFLLKGLSQSDRDAMGLDPNVSVVEKVPLVIQAPREVPLMRVGRKPA